MSLLENICSHCSINSIRELQLESFTNALIHFQNNEKYSHLLSEYSFNENNVSEKLINDMADLIYEEKILYTKSNNSFFITMTEEQIKDVYSNIDPEESKLIHEFLSDYRTFNTQKSLVK